MQRYVYALGAFLALPIGSAFPQLQVTFTHPSQVKLLKCLVDDIVVDISFETLGGLATVTFLESVDRRIGQNHLFKRSIILVSRVPVLGHISSPSLLYSNRTHAHSSPTVKLLFCLIL